MPDIEVTLDEIKDTTIKTQKDLDNLMRDWSKVDFKGAAKAAGAGFPTAGAGFLDTIIKSITGKGVMGAGIAAGGVAGGIMILAEVIKGLTKESKILSTFFDTVGKALGLLVDLILLPFLPILIWALVFLYTAIMWLGKIWNDFFNSGKTPKEAVFGPEDPSKKGTGALDPYAAPLLDLKTIWANWVEDAKRTWNAWAAAAALTWTQWVDAFNKTWKIWADAFWKTIDDWKKEFSKWWDGATKIISESWKKVTDGFEENFMKPIRGSLETLKSAFIGLINFVINKINDYLPTGLKLPTITTGVTPAQTGKPGESGSDWSGRVQVTNNFNGFTGNDLPPMVEMAMRMAEARYLIK